MTKIRTKCSDTKPSKALERRKATKAQCHIYGQ